MSQARALKFAGIGAVLVGAALWVAPPPQLATLLGETASETPVAATAVPAPAPEAAAPARVNPLEDLKPEDFEEILTRPLFDPDRSAATAEAPPEPDPSPPPDPPPPAGPTASAADFALLAIAGPEQGRVALVRFNRTNKTYRVRQGQFVEEWKVAAVGTRDAAIEHDGTTLTLMLFAGPPAGGAPPEAGAGPDQQAGQGDANGSTSGDSLPDSADPNAPADPNASGDGNAPDDANAPPDNANNSPQ